MYCLCFGEANIVFPQYNLRSKVWKHIITGSEKEMKLLKACLMPMHGYRRISIGDNYTTGFPQGLENLEKIKIFWKSHGKSWNFEKSSKFMELRKSHTDKSSLSITN